MQFKKTLTVLAATIALSQPALAKAEQCPDSNQILEATTDQITCLTIDDLKEIGMTTMKTSTIWTDGVHVFEGTLLSDLLKHLEAEGSEIEATAINDYSIKIPVTDAVADGPIVAYAMDGNPMSRRDKGPLWVIYPFDRSAKYRTETIYSRSIWQLSKIRIIN